MLEQPAEAEADCPLCPRLVAFRRQNRAQEPQWYNGAVKSFGSPDARLLIVGLAPGLRGANRTGRPFTGDYAGDLLYATLLEFGFACGSYAARPDDGLALIDCMITNAVRCVPPQNKPLPVAGAPRSGPRRSTDERTPRRRPPGERPVDNRGGQIGAARQQANAGGDHDLPPISWQPHRRRSPPGRRAGARTHRTRQHAGGHGRSQVGVSLPARRPACHG